MAEGKGKKGRSAGKKEKGTEKSPEARKEKLALENRLEGKNVYFRWRGGGEVTRFLSMGGTHGGTRTLRLKGREAKKDVLLVEKKEKKGGLIKSR